MPVVLSRLRVLLFIGPVLLVTVVLVGCAPSSPASTASTGMPVRATTEPSAVSSSSLSTLADGQADAPVPYYPADFGAEYGYIDAQGHTAIPPQFDSAEPFSDGLAQVGVGDSYGYIDKTGKLVTPTFAGAWPFSEDLAAVRVGEEFGYIDRSGRMVIQPQFAQAGEFASGLAPVEVGSQWGYIDQTGRLLIEPQFDRAEEFSEQRALVVFQGKKGFIDESGRLVVPARYDDAWRFSDGLAPVQQNGKWGFINTAGAMVIPPAFDDAWWFSEGLAPVRVADKWGYVNASGQMVISPGFDVAYEFSQGLAPVRIGQKCSFIDQQGHLVMPAKFDEAWAFVGELSPVRYRGLDGYFNKSGQKVWQEPSPLLTPTVVTEGDVPLPPASLLAESRPPIGLVVFDGDSLTIATGATDPFPNQLMRMWGSPVQWWNVATGGQSMKDMAVDGPAQVDTKFDPRRGRNAVVVWGGSNDLALWHESPEQVFELTKEYCLERRRQGFTVVLLTLLPRSGRIDPEDVEGRRQDLNTLLRAHWSEFADGIVDVGADPRLGQQGDELDRRYYQADRVHLNNVGLGLVAKSVYSVLSGL